MGQTNLRRSERVVVRTGAVRRAVVETLDKRVLLCAVPDAPQVLGSTVAWMAPPMDASGASAGGSVHHASSDAAPRAAAGPGPVRINAGGPAYTDANGVSWAADAHFSGGTAGSNWVFPVAGTDSDPLYYTRRFGASGYDIPVGGSGSYALKLHFTDPKFTSAGSRKFSVAAEGNTILSNFDVAAEGGGRAALVKSFTVAVNDGTLNLKFVEQLDQPIVSAIEVIPQAAGGPAPAPAPAPGFGIAGLTLINAASNAAIGPFTDGTNLDTSGGKSYNVRADAFGAAESVKFLLDGKQIRVESAPPYAVAGDANGGKDFLAWNVPAGSHTLTVIPYAGNSATGAAGPAYSVTFTVGAGGPVSPPAVPPPPAAGGPTLAGLTLFNAATDKAIGPFAAGAALDLSGGKTYSVVANPGSGVGSVKFLLDGKQIRIESAQPLAVAGDKGQDLLPWGVPAGAHTLTVIPYSGKGATGTAGAPVSVNFTAAGTAPTVPPPTPVPPPPSSGSSFTKINWATKASSPIIRAEALKATHNGRLYVFGGFSSKQGPVVRSDYYDPATNSWKRIADLPQRLTHVGVAQDAQDVYFVGGYVGIGPGYKQAFGSNKVWAYNFATNSYRALPNLPQALAAGGAAIVGRNLHYFGGQNSGRGDIKIHLVLNLDNPSAGWKSMAQIPHGRSHFGTVVFGGKIYTVAGQIGNDAGLTTQKWVDVYDPATNTWSGGAAIPKAVSHISSSTFEMGNRIIVAGGESAHNAQVRDVFAYTPATNSWQALSPLPAARFSGVSDVINGKIYFTTGGGSTATWAGTPA